MQDITMELWQLLYGLASIIFHLKNWVGNNFSNNTWYEKYIQSFCIKYKKGLQLNSANFVFFTLQEKCNV